MVLTLVRDDQIPKMRAWHILFPLKFGVVSGTLQGTNISPKNGILKMIFLFPRWDMLIPWRVSMLSFLGGRVSYLCKMFKTQFRSAVVFFWGESMQVH